MPALHSAFNSARAKALEAFCVTLQKARAERGITEALFRDRWLERLRAQPDLIASGWYAPPPDGLSVLTASDEDPARLSFGSLRDPVSWPSEKKVDWNGFLFAYSSCVDQKTGRIGDFDLTLYFGKSARLLAHYRACHQATARLLDSLTRRDTSRAIFERAEKFFSDAGLQNCVLSSTDITPLDLGHTFPSLPSGKCVSALSAEQISFLRAQRAFLNGVSDWPLTPGMQFSIEPQLRAPSDSSLPQISFHYLVQVCETDLVICRDIDRLIVPCLVA